MNNKNNTFMVKCYITLDDDNNLTTQQVKDYCQDAASVDIDTEEYIDRNSFKPVSSEQ